MKQCTHPYVREVQFDTVQCKCCGEYLPKRVWTPHRDYAGEHMPTGVFRDPQCEQCEVAPINEEFLACKYCATGYRQ